MENEKILKHAIELLECLDLTDSESVQFNRTKYDDGSVLVEVGVSYPATQEITVSTDDDEFVASISLTEGNGIVKDGYKVTGFDKQEERSEKSSVAAGSLESFTTKSLHEELLKREGVQGIEVGPNDKVKLTVDFGTQAEFAGPCRIITNFD